MAAASPDSDPPATPSPVPIAAPVVQSTSGGISLGAYNQIAQIGDLVAGDKISIVVYTGPANPETTAQHADLERAYRTEIAARYAVWKTRYAALTIQSAGDPRTDDSLPRYEREELVFAALRRMVADDPLPVAQDRAHDTPPPAPTTFTDLRDGLVRYGDLLLLGPPGSGKTTALWRLALDLAEAGLRGDTSAALPIFVRLGGLAQGQALLDLLQSELASAALTDIAGRQFALPAHRTLVPLLPMLIDSGRLVLLWDGLNEVPQSLFAHARRALDEFRRAHPGPLHGPRAHSVTTCRADDYALLVEQCGGDDPLPIQQATIQGVDPATIADQATFDAPHQLATGVRDVWVNGEHVLLNGKHTGAVHGRVVTGLRDPSA